MPGDIAKTVLMPGDPLRAQYIAEHYLENPVCFNTVRNMLGYTGTYKGKKVSVMGSGMGMPSIGLYSYELYHFYGVDNIFRIGSAGGLGDDVKVHDLIIAQGTCYDSNYAAQYGMPGTIAPLADFELLRKAVTIAESKGIAPKVGNVVSSDLFYSANPTSSEKWRSMGILAAEMESAALYMNAMYAHKKALSMFTVSDHIFTGEALSAIERQETFHQMMEVALDLAAEITE
jgi:purine-nucleoside phosphorylase